MKKMMGLALLLAMIGCARQSDVEQLRKEVDQLKRARTEQQEQLEKAVREAEEQLLGCRVEAEDRFSRDWKDNSEPVSGKPGLRSGPRDMLKNLREEEHRADADCQRGYDNAIQKAKLLYGS